MHALLVLSLGLPAGCMTIDRARLQVIIQN